MERERERERERETNWWIDGEREKETDWQIDGERERETDWRIDGEIERDDKKSDTHQKWSEVVPCWGWIFWRFSLRRRATLGQACDVVQIFFFFFFFYPRGIKSNLRYSETRYLRTDCIRERTLGTGMWGGLARSLLSFTRSLSYLGDS